VIGTFTGLVAGYTISWAAGTYRLIPLDPQSIPFRSSHFKQRARRRVDRRRCASDQRRRHADPARAASRILPVDILRYE